VLALAGSIVLSAGLFYAQAAQPPAPKPAATPAAPEAASPGDVAAALEPPPALTAPIPTEAELMAASAPVSNAAVAFALPPGVAPENGLQRNTIRVARALSILFPEIKTIGGYRQDPLKWHPNGLAIDVMIPNHNTEEGIKLGNQIAGYALANGKRWGVIHVIWRQGFYPVSEPPSWTADYGNETANHYDHVHIATNGGGYPEGDEQYYM
jgi:hypothetical protein